MFFWPEVEGFRGRTALGKLRRLNATVFRRRVLAGSPPALERRLIAVPQCSGQGIVAGQTGRGKAVGLALGNVRFGSKADIHRLIQSPHRLW